MEAQNRRPVTKGQIIEIFRQFGTDEIRYDDAQVMIEHRLGLGVPSLRIMHSRRLFDLGFGDVLGCETFEQYLDGTDSIEPVPQIPNFPVTHLRLFGTQSVTLVDGRIVEKIGLKEYLRLIGLVYSGEDNTLEPFDSKRAVSGVRWMIGQDGYRNRNRKPSDCRSTFASFEVGMDAVEGGALYAQNPGVIEGHYLDLVGSVPRGDRDDFAYLGIVGGRPKLGWDWLGHANPKYGAASRGE